MDRKPTYEELAQRVWDLEKEIIERNKLNDAFRESEQRYRKIFEQLPDSALLINIDNGTFIDFNDKACESLGYSREEFKKLRLSDIEVIESEAEIIEHMEKIIERGGDLFETKHRAKNGNLHDVIVSTKVVCIDGRKCVQSVCTDISRQKKPESTLRQSEERLRSILEASPNPVLLYDN